MMTQWRKDLQWRGPIETCSRSDIEAMADGVQRALSASPTSLFPWAETGATACHLE